MIACNLLSFELSAPSGEISAARILILPYPPRALFAFATLVQHAEQAICDFWGKLFFVLGGEAPQAAE